MSVIVLDKAKLKSAFQQIEKQHGPGTVFRLGSTTRLQCEVIPTNIMAVDQASGVGGLPRGRMVEIYGPNSGGKTTLTLQIIAEAQKNFGPAAFIDAEHALDPKYAAKLGVDVDNLIISQPDNGEQALEVAETLILSEQFSVIVIDSVAALVPKKELEGEMGDAQMGSQARLMSQAMRKLNAAVARTKTLLIFINQTRMKLGGYGNPETTTGGEALKFYASMRISVRPQPAKAIKQGENKLGVETNIQFIKNKLSAPFKMAEVDMIYGQGFEKVRNSIAPLVDLGILTKNGSWFNYGGENIAQGKEAAMELFAADPTLFNEIYAKGRVAMLTPPKPTAPAAPTELPSLADLEAESSQEDVG